MIFDFYGIYFFQGIGNSVATWQSCRLVLSGLYLYTFESEKSLDYQRYLWFVLVLFIIFLCTFFLSFYFFKFFFLLQRLLHVLRRLKYKVSMCSMAGRQVFEVPPANIGGSPYCLAVGIRGTDLKKVR